jgi:hypothetical protein
LADGEQYDREWQEDKKNGKGVQTTVEDDRYDGDWKWRGGEKHEKGVQTWPNDMRFEGEWKDGKRQATGRLVYPNGVWYEGHINDDLINQATSSRNPVMGSNSTRWTYNFTYQWATSDLSYHF